MCLFWLAKDDDSHSYTRSDNVSQKLFPIRLFSSKHKLQLKSGTKFDTCSYIDMYCQYVLPSSVVSCSEVKVIWKDTWYSSSHQELCMFSQAWVCWEGNGGGFVFFVIVQYCFCPDVSGFCGGTIVILGQTSHWVPMWCFYWSEREWTLKVCLLWVTVQPGTSGSSRTNTQGGP